MKSGRHFAGTGLLYKVHNNVTSPWKKGAKFRPKAPITLVSADTGQLTPSAHLNVSLFGTWRLKPAFLERGDPHWLWSREVRGLWWSVRAMCGLTASSQIGDVFSTVLFRARGTFLLLRSLSCFPAPHVSPTCAFGCRSRGDELRFIYCCFEQGNCTRWPPKVPSNLNDCIFILPRESDANSESFTKALNGSKVFSPHPWIWDLEL